MYLKDNMLVKWTNNDIEYIVQFNQNCDENDDPRSYENYSEMMCWVRDYSIGDKNEFKTPLDWWQDLVKRYVPDKDTLAYFLAIKPTDRYKAVPDPKREGRYLILEAWTYDESDTFYDRDEWYDDDWHIKYEGVSENEFNYWTLELLSISDCMNLLDPYAVWLPIWAYIHSGITITAGDRTYPYNDKWDSGQAGYIFISKKSSEFFLVKMILIGKKKASKIS